MRRAWIMAVLLCAGCTSSGGGDARSTQLAREDASYLASVSAGAASESASAAASVAATEAAAATAGAPIGQNYDTATCADWAATDAEGQSAAAGIYALEFNDPQPSADTATLVQIITSTCDAYGASETPRHAAEVSIATVYGH